MSKVKERFMDEHGEIMLESTIVMVITLFVLMAMISVGFLFYQQAMINTVASDLATDIASMYKYSERNYSDETEMSNALKKVVLYRSSLGVTGIKSVHQNRANKELPLKIVRTTLGLTEKEPHVESLEVKVDNVGRMHIEVTVSMECAILFGGALEYFGITDATPVFRASASAECIDITNYASYVHFVNYASGKVGDNTNNAISSIIGIFKDADSITDILLGGNE